MRPSRDEALREVMRRRRLDALVIAGVFNLKAIAGVESDNACLVAAPKGRFALFTDFRYMSAVKRTAPSLVVRDIARFALPSGARRVGYERDIAHSRFLELSKAARRAKFVEIDRDLAQLRAEKTTDEIAAISRAAALNSRIWAMAQERFRPGMTEREMARVVKSLMARLGDGEAFNTIVCVGANAAECHHVPDDTRWNGREAILVDMGVRLGGYCSDMTRCIPPKRQSSLYRRVYSLVKSANEAAIAAIAPGKRARDIDAVARKIIRQAGFGKCFGHSLGHGVGVEVHEGPVCSVKSDWVLKEGMVVTVEPGVYLEGNLGVRIEDLVLVTKTGPRVLS